MNNKLLPCPFCGGEAKIKSRYIGYGSIGLGSHDLYQVFCGNCESTSGEYRDKSEAIAAWNIRSNAEITAMQGEIAELRAELDSYKLYAERISVLPDCNTCADKNDCSLRPSPGAHTRINCHLWHRLAESAIAELERGTVK